MAASKPSQPTSRDDFEIAIVCTRALEYDAVSLLLDDFWDTDGDPFGRARGDLNSYTTGYMGKYNIVVVLLCNSGKATAAGTAASLRSSYPCIELLLLTGICEGVPDANGEELLLGDVVISKTVIEYDLGTQFAVEFKEEITLEDRHGRANKNIRNFTALIKSEEVYQRLEEKVALYLEKIQSRTSEAKYQRRRKVATYVYPGSSNDILFESTHFHRHYNSSQCLCANNDPDEDFYAVCDDSRDMDCEQTGCERNAPKPRDRLHQKNMLENGESPKSAQIPSIFLGRFGSGDTAFRSGTHRDSVAKKHNIIAFEMEGAGVWDELPCIIVKGVSGYGDGHKAKHWREWQHFAAAAAASVARALVERYPQTDKSPVTKVMLQENKDCLAALFITNPEDDKQRIEETKGGLLLDAYIWITRSQEYIQWLEDPETRLLWIKGDPGKGKTMLLCGIINELKPTKFGRQMHYFLCQATDVRLNNAAAILRGLMHMMVSQQPSLISYIRHEYDKSGKSTFVGSNSWIVLSRIFEKMLRDDNSLKERVFIIDALDECEKNLKQFLEMIVRTSSSFSQTKWLVSSRNEAAIQETLAAAKNKSSVSLELNAKSVSAAITTYIQHKVQHLSEKKGHKQPIRERIEKYLSDNANGTFLWVALVCALLEEAPKADPLPRSADYPPGLDQLYERMISRVCDPSISDMGRRVLAIAAAANRPLTKEELTLLINNNDDPKEIIRPFENGQEDIIYHCGSFLTMRNGTIYFVHQSAKDFLIKKESQRVFPNGIEYIHREIFETSISSMRNTLRKDMYGLSDPAFSIENLSQLVLNDDPLIPIRYGCVYWIDHFEQSISKDRAYTYDDSSNQELIHAFLRDKYIYWLEALSLLKNIFHGIAGMQRLEKLIAKSDIHGLPEFAWDARRFIQTFGNAIAEYPLQVYVSALIFSPAQSITRCRFKGEAPKWIQALPDGEVDWAPTSRTYEGSENSIQQLAVSCCGSWIASSSRGAITIWDNFSGKPTCVLDVLLSVAPLDHDSNQAGNFFPIICFSPRNGVELASSWLQPYDGGYQKDEQLMIWDITTGQATQQLRIENRIKSVSYLASAQDLIGCLSMDIGGPTILSIWDIKKGQMITRIELQTPSARGTLFPIIKLSPTDKNKIARSTWRRVEIVDINTGNTIRIFKNDTKNIKFSPDGSLIAVYGSKDVSISDTASGETKKVYFDTWIHDFAFSPNGKLLAIADEGTIHLLSLISGNIIRKIGAKCNLLIFSPDGNSIFSAQGSVINVVEMDEENSIAPGLLNDSVDKPFVKRDQVCISPNGKLVASILRHPSVIEVIDIDSKIFTHFLKHPYLDESFDHRIFDFSPDSKKIVIISARVAILWDISSKPEKIVFTRKSTFTFRSQSRAAFAFSPDSSCLAIVFHAKGTSIDSFYRKVKVWDINSGKRLMYLKMTSQLEIPYLCFSPDSKRLAIAYLDARSNIKVEIWDIDSNSAIQTIVLEERYRPKESNSCSGSSLNDEAQEGGYMFGPKEMHFVENDFLVLDLQPRDYSECPFFTRVVLRTKMRLELKDETKNLLRCKEITVYQWNSKHNWIEYKGKRLIWVPPNYRERSMHSLRNCMVLSHDIGFLSVIQFCHSELMKRMAPTHTSVKGDVACVPGKEIYTYLCELDKRWRIMHRDMNAPDDKMMQKMDSKDDITDSMDEIRDKMSVVRWKAKKRHSHWIWKLFGL
ncbi:hypothetical protein V8C35DRAFT_308322 [Trichoderma chlorosporum]